MSPARRTLRRRGWPAHLYEPRPGYFIFRKPDGSTIAIGRVHVSEAINEAIAANRFLMQTKPSLVAMLSGETNTVAELVGKIPAPQKASSARTFRSLDKIITTSLGPVLVGELSVKHCAALIEELVDDGHAHQAQAVRARLIAMCQRGRELGWMTANPAEVTAKPRAEVARSRLSLEQFLAIRDQGRDFLPGAMNLALVTGQDRSTLAAMKRSDVKDGRLICQRPKTERTSPPLAIPLSLHLQAIDMSLEAVLRARTGVVSPYVIHHIESHPGTPAGSPVHVDRISAAFTEARRAAGIPDLVAGKEAPTFHEVRSLASRLYKAQGGVDVKALLGHSTDAMAKLYASTRDMTPIEVKIANRM